MIKVNGPLCEYLIDMPHGKIRECSRRATVRLTYAPYGAGHSARDTVNYCRQHAAIGKRELCLTQPPEPIGGER